MDTIISQIHNKVIYKAKDLSVQYICKDFDLCIYLFEYAMLTEDKEAQSLAEEFIERICFNLPKEIFLFNLAEQQEISIAFDYMIDKGYIEGDINDILHDIDISIYKTMTSKSELSKDKQELLFSLFYCYIRLRKQVEGADEDFIFKELSINLFNKMLSFVDDELYKEPFYYTLYYKLPQFIYIIGKLFSLDFYNYRIQEILKERYSQIFSMIPILHANRLYLLWSMVITKNEMKTSIWDEHIELLCNNIDFEKIITIELNNKDIYLAEGISSILYFLFDLEKKSYKIPYNIETIYNKINKADIWQNAQWEKEKLSIKNGLCGLILTIQSLKTKKK